MRLAAGRGLRLLRRACSSTSRSCRRSACRSLVYVAVGYWAGRLRELRDPQGALVPIAVGAAATAVATIGYSLMQFLLGVDAPVSFLLVREILATILLNALHRGRRSSRSCAAGCCRALPEDPRRRRRRAYTTGGLSPLSRA